MRESEKKLYELEAEFRPNRYVALALTVFSFFIIGILLLNEAGIFLVSKDKMRLAVFVSLAILEIPLFAAGTDSGLRNSRTKYLMVGCTGIVAIIVCTMLNFHATLIIVVPMLLAAQYPSLKMSRIAVIASVICALFSPVIGYLTGTWDPAFFKWLSQLVGKTVIDLVKEERMSQGSALIQILLYLSLPHTLIVLAFSPLSAAIARSGEERLKNQIRVLHLSESDALTGLLNRMSYDAALTRGVPAEAGNAAVVYVDANDLHRLNNEKGHSAGDCLLICVAENLRKLFGDESVYRTGGDEFVAISYGTDLQEVRERVSEVCRLVEKNGYSISVGTEFAAAPCTLPALVCSAETKMRIDKERYHIAR